MGSARSPDHVRLATPSDVPTILQLVQELAEYEKLSHEVVGNESLLHDHLFGDRPYIESFIVEADGDPAGFALFFQNYSTNVGTPGYYLEDLFVRPTYRGRGLGKALLVALAQRAADRHFHHLRWSVLDWNAPAIAFYQKIGAVISETERLARITGQHLEASNTDVSSSWSIQPVTLKDLSESSPSTGDADPSNLRHSILRHLSEDQYAALRTAIAAQPPHVEVVMIYDNHHPIGFATFTHSYSTFLTCPGITVESIQVLPDYPLLEIQAVLINGLKEIAKNRNCGRLEWLIPHDDAAAIAQCESLGGTIKSTWRICSMNKDAISELAH